MRTSLRRLGTDYIDLYQLHYPDDTVPIADTLGALHELVAAGKVREIGCSNFTADQLARGKAAAGDGPSVRLACRTSTRSSSALPSTTACSTACDDLGIGFLPFYPLANGLLTGKVRPGEPLPEGTRLATMPPERSAHWLSDELLGSRRARCSPTPTAHDVSMLSLAFSWLLAPPGGRLGDRRGPRRRAGARERRTGRDLRETSIDELEPS